MISSMDNIIRVLETSAKLCEAILSDEKLTDQPLNERLRGILSKAGYDNPMGWKAIANAVAEAKDIDECLESHDNLVRDLDTMLNGDGAAPQARLCDIVSQVRKEGIKSCQHQKIR